MTEPNVTTETPTLSHGLLEQQLALGAYLQALLRPVPPEPVVTESDAEPAAAVGAALKSTQCEPMPPAGAVPRCEPPAPVTTEGYDWARTRFQCLLFRVAGITLAIPLAKLCGVLPWDADALTEMPNHRPWFLGLRTHLDQKVRVIDAAGVILPTERRDALPDAGDGRLGKVILIDEGRWGLACEAVGEVISLVPADVKWRSHAGTRPWLAGTVIERMCALIDAQAMADMLAGAQAV